MSGKWRLKTRPCASKDKRYVYYPEAILEITAEPPDARTIRISPPYLSRCTGDSIEELLTQFRKHELKVDLTRRRKGYTSKFLHDLNIIVQKLEKLELSEFDEENIEPEYWKLAKLKEVKKENGKD